MAKKSGWLHSWLDTFGSTTCGETVVRIGENARGGWSIYPVNDVAIRLFCGNAEAGNFGTYADAHRRAAHDNCWTVVDAPSP